MLADVVGVDSNPMGAMSQVFARLGMVLPIEVAFAIGETELDRSRDKVTGSHLRRLPGWCFN